MTASSNAACTCSGGCAAWIDTALSFYLHEADPATLDLDAFMADLYTKFSPFPPTPGTYVYANFGHLMGYT